MGTTHFEWVQGDRVDYAEVLSGVSDLKRFAATLAEVGPTTTPDRFPTEEDRLAYYINAYNALTLLGVVDNWPISSVQDVRGWLDPRPGFGFFYGLRFFLDGDKITLYDLENGSHPWLPRRANPRRDQLRVDLLSAIGALRV